MDLTEKVAFVTGGSGDIGGAIARALAASGVNVAVSYVGEAGRAAAAVDAARKLGRQSLAVQLDQRDPKSIDSCVNQVIGHFGQIDVLVNNAAWNIGIPFAELDALTADIWDRVLETNLRGPFLLSRAFALAPDVTVNCIAPGLVEGTRMADRVPEEMKQLARAQTVLGRTGSADDIAQLVVTYCKAGSVTGQTVVVDGGSPVGMR